jgi:hypothetical protein
MIATDRFVVLQLHKSGGAFVAEFLLRFMPSARVIGHHLPRLLIPKEYAGLPVLGFVRNPWRYYASWYNFQTQRVKPNALFSIVSDEGRLDFAGTVRNLLDLGSGSDRLDGLLRALPQTYGSRGLNLPGYALASIRNSGLGFYSYLYQYLYGELDDQVKIARADQLREELLEFLDRVGQRVTNAMRDFVLDTPAHKFAALDSYAELYTPELRDVVAARDALIIARHGYRFGD